MIVADYNNHRVVLLDEAGTWLMTIDLNVRSFKNPYGLALEPEGNIHVVAYGSNTINVFTREGTYVRSYKNVHDPAGIVVDKEGCSLINEWNGNCLSIFDPHKNKVHTVGNLNKTLRCYFRF